MSFYFGTIVFLTIINSKAIPAIKYLKNKIVIGGTLTSTNLLTTYKLPQAKKVISKYKYAIFLFVI